MTRCCPRPRMRWSGATDAIARGNSRSTGYARKHKSGHAWRWTCGAKPKAKGAVKPSRPYMRHVLAEVTRYPCYSLQKAVRAWTQTRFQTPIRGRKEENHWHFQSANGVSDAHK